VAVDAAVDPTPVIAAALGVLTPAAGAPRASLEVTEEVLASFEEGMHTFNVPGSAVAIVQNGEIIYARGFGARNLETGEPVTTSTVFRVGSTTKSMTSMMIATLVDEGVLDWDTPAIEIYPEFKLPTEELTQSVTVRELMGMGTGLGTMSLSIILLWDEYSASTLLSALATFPVLSERGHFHYNDQLYASAAYLAAIAAGHAGEDLLDAYKSLMQAHVFDPIGMESAVIADDPTGLSDDYAVSYGISLAGGPEALEKVPYAALNADAPAGGVIASVTDMARFLITQLQKGVSPDGVPVVSAENLTEPWEPQTTITDAPPWATPPASYGMGWIDERYGDVQILWHEGAIDGFRSEMAMLPEANAGIIILSNSSTGELFNKAMRYRLIELLYDMEPQASEVVAAVFQEQFEELAAAAAMFASAQVDAEAVAPYLGDYEHGWRLEQRDDATLWLVRPGWGWELQLLPTPDGYVVSNGDALGTQIGFAAGEDGKLKLTISFGGEPTEIAKLP
jgi:CubicO group peptidase (beta-lactamase class C family)